MLAGGCLLNEAAMASAFSEEDKFKELEYYTSEMEVIPANQIENNTDGYSMRGSYSTVVD